MKKIKSFLPPTFQADEQSYVLSANEDVEMKDVEDEEEDEEEIASDLNPDEEGQSYF